MGCHNTRRCARLRLMAAVPAEPSCQNCHYRLRNRALPKVVHPARRHRTAPSPTALLAGMKSFRGGQTVMEEPPKDFLHVIAAFQAPEVGKQAAHAGRSIRVGKPGSSRNTASSLSLSDIRAGANVEAAGPIAQL